ncbi:MAG: Fe-S-containing hydro-lyase [Erysipelotrichaceae bacterium]
MTHLDTPITKDKLSDLKAGEIITISGVIYTARDAAHKKMSELLKEHKPLPFDIKDAVIYYVGPTPARSHQVIGSAGPTTSSRMDAYAPSLYDLGMSVSIGKGYRTKKVVDSIKKNRAAYMVAIGGAGAYLSKCIVESKVIAFDELGAEAIRRLVVKDFPVTLCIDSQGGNLYE